DLARAGAAVAGHRVAVVADLRRLDDAIAAVLDLEARRALDDALEARLLLAVGAATVARDRVAVVALLVVGDLAIAADPAAGRAVGVARMRSTTREETECCPQNQLAHHSSDYASREKTQSFLLQLLSMCRIATSIGPAIGTTVPGLADHS